MSQYVFSNGKVDLVGSIGGSLGLCCGMSLLSFAELVELLIEVCYLVVRRSSSSVVGQSQAGARKAAAATASKPNDPIQITAIA